MVAVSGRPTKRTPERERAVIDAIARGATRRLAAAWAALSEDTLQRWQRDDAAFAARVAEAESEHALRLVAMIEQQAPRDWKAASFLLERRHRQDFGPSGGDVDVATALRALAEKAGLDGDGVVQLAGALLRGEAPLLPVPPGGVTPDAED